jgi:hypothetical protein
MVTLEQAEVPRQHHERDKPEHSRDQRMQWRKAVQARTRGCTAA